MSSYDQTDQRNAAAQIVQKPTPTIKMNLSEEVVPIFQKRRIDFDPPGQLLCMCVCNNQLIMGLTKNFLIKIDLDAHSSPDEIKIPKPPTDAIEKLFLDPMGFHLIIVMTSGDSFYLHKSSAEPKLITKMKGHRITAVAWNNQLSTEASTGPILLGTSKGILFEMELTSASDSKLFSSTFEAFHKQIHDCTRDKPRPITGLLFDKVPSKSDSRTSVYFFVVIVQGRLYQFVSVSQNQSENSFFAPLFADFPERFQDIPCSAASSQIATFGQGLNKLATKLAWLTDGDVFYGRINMAAKNSMDDVIVEAKLFPINPDEKEEDKRPRSIALTAFHCLVLFNDRLNVFCLLNNKLVETDVFDGKFGEFCGLTCDPIKKTIWAYTSKTIFKYTVVEETRDIWKMYLNMKEFNLAKQFCPNIEKYYEEILNKEADHLFSIGSYTECALMYARSRKPFEEVALNLSKLDNKEPLKQFLKAKFMDLTSKDKIQLTILMAWLFEIWLNEMGGVKVQDEEKYKIIREEFRSFVVTPRVKECIVMNHRLVYDLLLSHGNVEDLIFVATLIHDHDKVISHHLQHQCFIEAINVLSKQNNTELLYKYIPHVMKKNPKETVDLLIRRSDGLDPKRVGHLLIKCDEGKLTNIMRETVRYLEFCLGRYQITDKLFHNHLISLYIKLKLKDQLMKYLLQQGEDAEAVCYDTLYALRLCAEQDLHEACIQIYTTMQLYNEAVDLALKTNVGQAQKTASKPREDDDLKRKLWLKITRHMIKQNGDVVKAMEFIKGCDRVSIQDILPYFPDFTTIDHFKEAICSSLKKYNDEIESLKKEMVKSNEDVLEIKEQIESFKNRCVKIEKDDKCICCQLPLMMRPFYVFPCKHNFHLECLLQETWPHVTKERRHDIEALHSEASSSSSSFSTRAKYKKKLDEQIAFDCIYCGDVMIESVVQPFIEEERFQSALASWL